MFTKPKHGWTNLQFKDFSERASYLTDIPIECLDAFIYSLQNNSPVTIYFDAEGWDYYLVSFYYKSYIVINKEQPKLIIIDKDHKKLAKELTEDIEKYLDGWVYWECYKDDEDEFKERRIELNRKLLELKELIK
jgi:hypothetical protein